MQRVSKLKKRLENISPEHDTPVGLIHPYWARKPMNVVTEIIKCLSKPGDLILDPFMGSGTIIFSALSLKRSIIGTDINPLSVFLVKSILELGFDTKKMFKYAECFVEEFSNTVLPWYKISNDGKYIERERYLVKGDFENGNFSLSLSEIVTKKVIRNRWSERKVINSFENLSYSIIPKTYLNKPINFAKIELPPNSRIAIPKGARLSHFYSEKNTAAINFAIELINTKDVPESIKDMYMLLLSSSLPMLRLSDKKASSQWPYWRPKKMLTSRNPVMVFSKRLDALREAIEWINNNINNVELIDIEDIFGYSQEHLAVCIKEIAVQKLLNNIHDKKVDLIITDPPYSDQIPYLEYSALWINLLNLKLPKDAYKHEIVKTDSSKRLSDSKNYLERLSNGFDICCKIVREDGFIVWFYQDQELRSWSCINETARKNNVDIVEIIPIPKQRRSIKTVTSPGSTLDGDLICIFQKKRKLDYKKENNFDEMVDKLSFQLNSINHKSYFEKYSCLIKYSLKENYIHQLYEKFETVKNALNYINKT